MTDISKISDEELLGLIGASQGGGPQVDRSSIPPSDREVATRAARVDTSNPIVAGARHVADKVVSGGAQGYLGVRKLFSPNDPAIDTAQADLAASEGKKDTYYKAFAGEHPMGTEVGEVLPQLPLSGGGLVSAGLKSAIPGLLSYGNADERAANGVMGAGAGMVGNAVSRVTGRFLNPPLSAAQRRTLAEGRDMGLNPRLSQVTESPGLADLEDWAGQMPFGSAVMGAHNRANTTAINRGAANSMLQPPDEAGRVGESVFQNARNDLGGVFRRITELDRANGGATIQLGSGVSAPPGGARITPQGATPGLQPSPLTDAADEVLRRQGVLMPQGQNRQAIDMATMLRDASMQNGAAMTGEQYQASRSLLTRLQHEAFSGGDAESGHAYERLLGALDDMADTSLRRAGRMDLADELQAARPAYGNMKLLERGRVSQGGDVTADRVAQAQRTQNPSAFRQGNIPGPLGTIGRWGEQFPPLGRGSQTAGREATGRMVRQPGELENIVGAVASPVLAKLSTSPIVTRIPATIGGTAVGKAAETVLPPIANAGVQSYFRRLFTRPQTP